MKSSFYFTILLWCKNSVVNRNWSACTSAIVHRKIFVFTVHDSLIILGSFSCIMMRGYCFELNEKFSSAYAWQVIFFFVLKRSMAHHKSFHEIFRKMLRLSNFLISSTQRGKLNWSLQRQLEDLSRQKQQSWRRRPTTLLVQIFQRKESKTKEVIIIIAAFHVFDFNHGNEQFQIETSTFQKKMKRQNLWTEKQIWQNDKMNQS